MLHWRQHLLQGFTHWASLYGLLKHRLAPNSYGNVSQDVHVTPKISFMSDSESSAKMIWTHPIMRWNIKSQNQIIKIFRLDKKYRFRLNILHMSTNNKREALFRNGAAKNCGWWCQAPTKHSKKNILWFWSFATSLIWRMSIRAIWTPGSDSKARASMSGTC